MQYRSFMITVSSVHSDFLIFLHQIHDEVPRSVYKSRGQSMSHAFVCVSCVDVVCKRKNENGSS
jgi:hypothetical protein